jgi:cytochrome b
MPKPAKTDGDFSAIADARRSSDLARVWDPIVRIFHWSLVLSFGIAWVTSHSSEEIHQWAGYFAAALILLRLLWGVVGTRHARFSEFVRDPATIMRYVSAVLAGREARYIGHNPAGGAMVLALMAAMALTALTGWMMTTDVYFGVAWVGLAHDMIAHALLLLVVVHISGVIFSSFRHRENLVAAMFTGRKRR